MFEQSRFFETEQAALDELERIAWDGRPVCPHCSSADVTYDLRKVRPGLRKCRRCARQFTVRVGTLLEGSHVPAHKWLQAAFLISAFGRRMSARRLARVLDISYKSAWSLANRLRPGSSVRARGNAQDAIDALLAMKGSVVEGDCADILPH